MLIFRSSDLVVFYNYNDQVFDIAKLDYRCSENVRCFKLYDAKEVVKLCNKCTTHRKITVDDLKDYISQKQKN